MMNLPSPIATVRVPEVFSPSQLSLATQCRLRAVLSASSARVGRLATNPAAERGSVFHQLLERAGRGIIPLCGSSRQSAERELCRLLDALTARLASDPSTAHFARLEEAFPTAEWHNDRQRVLAIATRLINEAIPLTSSPTSTFEYTPVGYEDLGPSGRWPEVRIRASDLRLSGRIDVVEKYSDGQVIVRDYKSGQVHDREGRLRPSVELQLRLYALAVLNHAPRGRVQLFVSWDSDEQIPLDDSSIERTRDWLLHMLEGLPPGAELSAKELAEAGPHCASCSFRPVCGAYLKGAPTLWMDGTAGGPMPLDTWGRVTSSARSADGRLTVDLVDAAGRRVRILRLDERHADPHQLESGAKLWFFGLASAASRPVEGRWLHPRNFYELPVDPGQRRAWSLAVFGDPHDCTTPTVGAHRDAG